MAHSVNLRGNATCGLCFACDFYLQWSAEVLPTLPAELQMFGPELRKQAVEVLGKYSLLGETAAVRHRPMYLQIAMCEHEIVDVRMCAMQVGEALGVVARGCRAIACSASVCADSLRLCFVQG